MQHLQCTMIARIDLSEFHNNRYFTVVTTPAPDAFSHPSRFKVQSTQPIGQQGQSVELLLDVGGIVREKNYEDKQTRQRKTFHEADVYLNVISAKPYVQHQQQPTKAQAQG